MIKNGKVEIGTAPSVLSGALADAIEEGEPYAARDLEKKASERPKSVESLAEQMQKQADGAKG